jgi:hypothetical protein
MSPPRPRPASIWARTHSERHLVLPQPLPARMSQIRQLPAGGSCSGLAQKSQVYANADRASSERLPRDRSSFDFCSGVSNANGDISPLPTTLGTHVALAHCDEWFKLLPHLSRFRLAHGCDATGMHRARMDGPCQAAAGVTGKQLRIMRPLTMVDKVCAASRLSWRYHGTSILARMLAHGVCLHPRRRETPPGSIRGSCAYQTWNRHENAELEIAHPSRGGVVGRHRGYSTRVLRRAERPHIGSTARHWRSKFCFGLAVTYPQCFAGTPILRGYGPLRIGTPIARRGSHPGRSASLRRRRQPGPDFDRFSASRPTMPG